MKTETLRVRNVVDGCEPGRVSDGSRLALCQTLSIECPSFVFFCPVYFVILVPFSLSFFCVFVFFFCSHWSLVDVPLIFFCPADHVPDWQPRVLLGMVEARSVNVKKTTTTYYLLPVECVFFNLLCCCIGCCWLAVGGIPNSLYRVSFYTYLACTYVLCVTVPFLCRFCFVFCFCFDALVGACRCMFL